MLYYYYVIGIFLLLYLANAKVEPLNSELIFIVTIFVSFVLLIFKYNHFYQLFSKLQIESSSQSKCEAFK